VRDKLLPAIRKTAHHVYRPEMVAVGDRLTRIPELDATVNLPDAVKMWLDARPPPLHDREVVELELDEYIDTSNRQVTFDDVRLSFSDFVLRKIMVKNFMPFDEGVVADIPDGVIGVTAKYAESEGRSNRAGKSALVEAIPFALYGEARKVRTLDDYVRKGADSMEVLVEFEHFAVKRTRTAAGQGLLYIDNEKWKAAEGADEIVKMVGAGREDFMRICFVRQGDLHGVLGETSSEINSHVVRWLGVAVWDRVSKLIRADMADVESKLQLARMKSDDAQKRADDNEVPDEDVEQAKKDLEEVEARSRGLVDVQKDVEDLTRRLQQASRVADARKVVKREKISGKINTERYYYLTLQEVALA